MKVITKKMNDGIMTTEKQLGRRVEEILVEKNIAPWTFCENHKERLPFSGHTFLKMLRCERPIMKKEIEAIAACLDLKLERVKGSDLADEISRLDTLVSVHASYKHALKCGKALLPKVIGWTERFDVLYAIGRAHLELKECKEAHGVLQHALVCAETVYDRYQDQERYFNCLKTLAAASRKIRDYYGMENWFLKAQDCFCDQPDKKSQLEHLQALNCYLKGDITGTKEHYNQALQMYRQQGDPYLIGRCLMDMAAVEHKLKRYEQSRPLLEEGYAITPTLSDRILMAKDLVITLHHLHEDEAAKELLETAIADTANADLDDLRAKLLLMKSFLHGEISFAEEAQEMQVSDTMRVEIADYLMRQYVKSGQLEKARYCASVLDASGKLFMDKEGF